MILIDDFDISDSSERFLLRFITIVIMASCDFLSATRADLIKLQSLLGS